MKKSYLVWLLVAAVGLCILVGCGDKNAKTNYTGTWKVSGGKANVLV